MYALHVLIRIFDERRPTDGEAFASCSNAAKIGRKAPVNFILLWSLTLGVCALNIWERQYAAAFYTISRELFLYEVPGKNITKS